jgi:type IV pilus assembly protein PilE
MQTTRCPVGRRPPGLTLIEVLVVLVMLSILAAVAIPSYRDHVLRGKVTEAPVELALMAVRLEQFYQDNRTYRTAAGACGGFANPSNKNFNYSCASPNSESFVLTARGKTAQGIGDFQYELNQAGDQRTRAPASWGNGDCWITRRGGVC